MMTVAAKQYSLQEREGRILVSKLAMSILLVSLSMLFAAFFLGYAVYRFQNPIWPPMGMPRPPLGIPTLSTCIIFLSSLGLILCEVAYKKELGKYVRVGLLSTFFLAICFMVSQFFLWDKMHQMGLFVESGVFPSLLYTFTWVHAAHIVAGIIGLLFLLPILNGNKRSFELENRMKNIAKFWHFLGIIWFFIYTALFIF